MRIVVLIRKGNNPGGGVASMETLANQLASQHEVEVLTVNPHRWLPDFRIPVELKVFLLFFLGILEFPRVYRELRRFNPDLVFSQHEMGLLGSIISTPQVLFLRGSFYVNREHNFSDIELRSDFPRSLKKISSILPNKAFGAINRKISKQVTSRSSVILSNSEYTANEYKTKNDIHSSIIYPLIDISNFETENTGESILHVNPSYHKGIDITLSVAEKLPEQHFLIVGSAPEDRYLTRINRLDNVTFHGYADNMRSVYSQCRLVLMPSRFEPFGRIPIEAGISGIPTIVANSGGLPESVGTEDLVVEQNSSEHYVEKISKIEDNYDMYSTLSKENAREKSANSQIARLKRTLREVADIDI